MTSHVLFEVEKQQIWITDYIYVWKKKEEKTYIDLHSQVKVKGVKTIKY